ncbi:hypothetical protein HPB47_017911 [Ixodes persulcatus]|uniref:Uncharacterized protein n=1 Tax=Ixodes persulcatus TaxID=34615 RepID=A0AC60QM50_IXOPE|nr:hypothetical protein HPB47_017911 [Ixodes persulcatus]
MTDMQQDLHTLGVDLGHLEDSPFAKHLRSLQVLGTDSMFGIVPEGSGISYQHPVSPHGFKTYISPNIVQCGTDASKSVLPTWPVLFTSSNTYLLRTEILSATKTSLLQGLRRKHERRRELRALHGSTEQAAPTSALFLAVPEPFGLGVRSWLARFGEAKRGGVLGVVGNDLALHAVHRHGITHEPHAVRNYERALRCRGHRDYLLWHYGGFIFAMAGSVPGQTCL